MSIKMNGKVRVLVSALCLVLMGTSVLAADDVLRLGDRGSEVRKLQNDLKSLGYPVNPDGVFGEETLNALELFQKNNGLKQDGAAGRATFEKLHSANAQGEGVLRSGDRGNEVRKMQQALKDLNYPLHVDGVFGTDTLSSLKSFQTRNGLVRDGAAGTTTLGLLYSGSALGYAGDSTPDTTAIVDTQRNRTLALRSSRSDSSDKNIVARIPSGSKLTVLSKGTGWTRVKYLSKSGYVLTGFLSFPSKPEKLKKDIKSGEALVVTQPGRVLNLRSSASKKNENNIIDRIPSGTVVRLVNAGTNWSKVSYGNKTGYVMSGFLQFP